MKSTKQHYEEWKHVLPNFTEEQKRKLYFMMNDYARDYHESEVKKLTIPVVVGRSEQLSCGRNITTCVFYKDGGKCSNLEYCRDQTT